MPVDTTFAGRVYPPGDTYVVSREKLREFAEATGATHPAHTDVDAARALGHPDVVAPPTFAVVVAQRAEAQYVEDPTAGIDFSRVVHADERFTHHRPIRAGDHLRTTLHVDAVTQRAGLSMITTRCEIADAAGEPVATVVSTLAVRPEDDA
ncbi:MaoC family dehydratase N-terminal domain-containing protein [Cellulomonas dongxiuzhuiae]|uniref:MaoC family dehydratase N-terminal domain-containing protein n=1 Tax=Cellulomonas dongxiuzhuiae TaxID=2819979 RepID=UPI001AAF8491|nr:MaoC family dehydratase N-terminal domain-containing protein [Cellulomonas dongxiuzhuiae]MBO3088425.1 MaoC family dehydratase N-terminal domain-containing protein [Cellulomonas dongxiuzhuiae]